MFTVTISGAVVTCEDEKLQDVLTFLLVQKQEQPKQEQPKEQEPAIEAPVKYKGKHKNASTRQELAAMVEQALNKPGIMDTIRPMHYRWKRQLCELLAGTSSRMSDTTLEKYAKVLGIFGAERKELMKLNGGL